MTAKTTKTTNDWIEQVCCPRPTDLSITIGAGPGQPTNRELNARLFILAAELERRSEQHDWIIQIGDLEQAGNGRLRMGIMIELASSLERDADAVEHMLTTMTHDIALGRFTF